MLACAQLVEPGKKRKIGGHIDGDVLRRPLLRGVTGRDPSGSYPVPRPERLGRNRVRQSLGMIFLFDF